MDIRSIVCIRRTSFGETVFVGDIVNGIDEVECVGAGSVKISLDGGGLGRVLGEDEVEASGRLGSGGGLSALE